MAMPIRPPHMPQEIYDQLAFEVTLEEIAENTKKMAYDDETVKHILESEGKDLSGFDSLGLKTACHMWRWNISVIANNQKDKIEKLLEKPGNPTAEETIRAMSKGFQKGKAQVLGNCANPQCPINDSFDRMSVTLKKCSKCKITMYCGSVCQKNHWQEHKKECKEKE